MSLSVFCVVFMKLIIDKMKELMRRHDVMAFKVDDYRRNEKVNLETKFSSDWNERLWTGGVLSKVFEIHSAHFFATTWYFVYGTLVLSVHFVIWLNIKLTFVVR